MHERYRYLDPSTNRILISITVVFDETIFPQERNVSPTIEVGKDLVVPQFTGFEELKNKKMCEMSEPIGNKN